MRNRNRLPLPDDRWVIEVTDDGSRTLVETLCQDGHHSSSGALTETRHVYLNNSQAATRLAAGLPTAILEIGLGTGMALLVTLDAARKGNAKLAYVALEHHWPPPSVLEELQPEDWVEDRSLVAGFLGWRSALPDPVPRGDYEWRVDEQRTVRVVVGDAALWSPDNDSLFDAVYFDPFAPRSNPALWSAPFVGRVSGCLKQGGRLVTYGVSRSIRETMESVGLVTQRVRGPDGGKREVLIATRCEGPIPICGETADRVQRGNASQPTTE